MKKYTVRLNNDFYKFKEGDIVPFGPLGGFLCKIENIEEVGPGQHKITVSRVEK